ncbi:CSMD [Mytilus coruscus]|uniref:CSMD n=1 Tax=Mytilus coruscus TaxID=42192 RepID=A0A6J8BJB5_MYTCO|nr:CSMD [Mytilus coruscus]
MCVRDCLLQHECNAVNYHENKTCELLITEESDMTSNTDDYYYSSITNWTMNPNQCWPNPCINRQMCIIALYGNHICVPVDDFCLINNPCLNGATCRNTVGGVRCVCPGGFSGEICEITPCTVNPCGVGSCAINGNTYQCTCPGHYTGHKCEKISATGNSVQHTVQTPRLWSFNTSFHSIELR